jgi:hypothetical protein
MDPGGVQPQPLKRFDDRVEVDGGRRWNWDGSPHQVPLTGGDEMQAPEAYMRSGDLANVVDGHPKPDEENDKTRKAPYLTRQLSGF